jgi:hypothetical protein
MGHKTSKFLHKVELNGVHVTKTMRYGMQDSSMTYCMYNVRDGEQGGECYLLDNAGKAKDILRELTLHRPEQYMNFGRLMWCASQCTKLEKITLLKCGSIHTVLSAARLLAEGKSRSLRNLCVTFDHDLIGEETRDLRSEAAAAGWYAAVHAAAAEYTTPAEAGA